MTKLALDMTLSWRSRIYCEYPEQSTATRESVISWLLGNDLERFEMLNHTQMEIAQQRLEYRYRVLRHRYLGLRSERAYRNLITRLGSLVIHCNKIHKWITKSCENQLAVMDVLQKIIQELLQTERYMQQQMVWIAHCSHNSELRNALLFASTEEYCLHPVGNQPLLVHRFFSYLRSYHWNSLTSVPTKELIQLVSEESLAQNSEDLTNLLDPKTTAHCQVTQLLEQQVLRTLVQQEFMSYLAEHVGPAAVRWLQLYLQGQSTEMIARSLKLQVKEVHQLRQEIILHAVHVLALKSQPELVG